MALSIDIRPPFRQRPAILVVSSTVTRGAIGGRAASFALERLGFPVWSVQTVALPWHPGYTPTLGRTGRIVPSEADFDTLIADLIRAPWLGEIGGILTGYMGAPSQPPAVARLIDAIKAKRPDALYLCDPVMGDARALYVPPATAAAIRDHLAPRADVLTPNRTELAFLASGDPASGSDLTQMARSLAGPRIVVTSAQPDGGDAEMLMVTSDAVVSARHELMTGAVPHGTGDLLAGLLLGRLLDGHDDREALRLASAGVLEALHAARALGLDELPLALMQDRLIDPRAEVEIGLSAATA